MDAMIDTFKKLSLLPAVRQIVLLTGLAISIAVGVAIVLWSQAERYSPLFTNLDGQELGQVVAALDRLNADYQVDAKTGVIAVPVSAKDDLRLKLANEGMPERRSSGFDVLYLEPQLGTSTFIEKARFNRALEEELAASIATLNAVRSARVHLAIPRRSSFVRSQKEANASVIVELKTGHVLDEGQAAGIVRLVASSVPELSPRGVTLVDQQGRLLSNQHQSQEMLLGGEQFQYLRALEQKLSENIVDILEPILGEGKIHAKVAADLNFTFMERTVEAFDPSSVVSQQPSLAVAEGGVSEGAATQAQLSDQPLNEDNYEIDRSISHIKESPGSIRRLSVAVVVDYRTVVAEDGSVERLALTQSELNEVLMLVREAIGFNETRGDSVSITNAPFIAAPVQPLAEIPAAPIWQQAWVQTFVKQLLGFIALLVLLLGVIRPLISSMTRLAISQPAVGKGFAETSGISPVLSPAHSQGAAEPHPLTDYNRQIAGARNLAQEDPTRVAQVLRGWVAADG